MKFVRKFPAIRRGQHADERIYRGETWQPCASCGEVTDWVDTRLHVSVCSEECEYAAATRDAGQGSGAGGAPPRYVIFIQRGRRELFETLARALGPEHVRWDRRQGARRAAATTVGVERREADRRGGTGGTVGFVGLASPDAR
jgi:hypothetical protein